MTPRTQRVLLCRSRRGFSLLAVLWIVVALAVVAMTIALATQEVIAAARNRRALAEARWIAAGCLESARADAALALRQTASAPPGDGPWMIIESIVDEARPGCALDIRASGDAVNVNAVGEDRLVAVLVATGTDSAHAVSMRDALLDWRDADTVARPLGAERSWYLAAGRTPPRDGLLLARGEMALIRAWDGADIKLRAMFDIEPGRVVLMRAPLPVLLSLPGVSMPAALGVVDARSRGARLIDLPSIVSSLASNEDAAQSARLPELSALLAEEPDAWIVRATAGEIAPVTLEQRWARSGTRVAIVRHDEVSGGGW